MRATPHLAPATEMALMFADRAQAIAEVIQPALDDGKIILCDRFTDSSEAYQGGGRELGSETILAMHRLVCGNLQPDLTLLLLPNFEASLPAPAAAIPATKSGPAKTKAASRPNRTPSTAASGKNTAKSPPASPTAWSSSRATSPSTKSTSRLSKPSPSAWCSQPTRRKAGLYRRFPDPGVPDAPAQLCTAGFQPRGPRRARPALYRRFPTPRPPTRPPSFVPPVSKPAVVGVSKPPPRASW